MAKAQPRAPGIRFRVDPVFVSAEKAGRRVGLTAAQFAATLPAFLQRGFPAPDPTTGLFFLPAIDRWAQAHYRRFFPELTGVEPVELPSAPAQSMGERFRAAKERRRDG